MAAYGRGGGADSMREFNKAYTYIYIIINRAGRIVRSATFLLAPYYYYHCHHQPHIRMSNNDRMKIPNQKRNARNIKQLLERHT